MAPLLGDMMTELRHVRHNPPMMATLLRALAFFIFAAAYWSLLPLIARNADGGGAQLYGTLLTLIGAGAVAGALVLPRLQGDVPGRLSSDAIAQMGSLGTALALIILALIDQPAGLMVAAFLGGVKLDCCSHILSCFRANGPARLGSCTWVGGVLNGFFSGLWRWGR